MPSLPRSPTKRGWGERRRHFLFASRLFLQSTYLKWAQCPLLGFEEERMLKKTSAGLLRFHLAVFLAGACWTGWGKGGLAAELPAMLRMPEAGAAVEPESIPAAAPESGAESVPRLPPGERLETLKSADVKTLKAAQADCLKAAKEFSEKGPELRRQMQKAYEDARLNSPEAKALQQQIRDLETQLEQTLRDAPGVREKLQAIQQAEQDMLAELQLRTALGGLIAAREQTDPAQIPE
jgi:hypothetical protein